MPRPFSGRRAVKKIATTATPDAAPVAVYDRHGTGNSHLSESAQRAQVLSFIGTHPAYSPLLEPTHEPTAYTRPATRRGIRRRWSKR